MLRISSLFALVALLFASAQSETIVIDNFGNTVSLPLGGGNATGTITNLNSLISTSPYTLTVFVNDGGQNEATAPGAVVGADESFWVQQPINGKFGNATLVASAYSPQLTGNMNWSPAPALTTYLANETNPNTAVGAYRFTFTIPVLSTILVNLTYINGGAPQPVTDLISITVFNPSSVVGDPQFVGLRGQSFQVHGIDGAVYNIISEARTQVNSRFVFLNEGECPIVNGAAESNCWSHPGSYLGEMSFQQIVDGKLHKVLVVAGPAKNGFSAVTLDGKDLAVGDEFTYGSFSIKMVTVRHITLTTENFSFELSNSDNFINQAVANRVALSKLTSHGLLGQTHQAKVYPTSARYIQGEVDDYVIADNDIFGTDFAYNKFSL